MGRGVWTPRSRVFSCGSGVSRGDWQAAGFLGTVPTLRAGKGDAPHLPSAASRDRPDSPEHPPRLLPISKSHSQKEREERPAERKRQTEGGDRRAQLGEGSPSGRQRDPPTPPGGSRPAACSNKLETPVT